MKFLMEFVLDGWYLIKVDFWYQEVFFHQAKSSNSSLTVNQKFLLVLFLRLNLVQFDKTVFKDHTRKHLKGSGLTFYLSCNTIGTVFSTKVLKTCDMFTTTVSSNTHVNTLTLCIYFFSSTHTMIYGSLTKMKVKFPLRFRYLI